MRADLLQALSAEIATAEATHRRPGWTTWALVGAVAAGGAQLLSEFEGGPPNYQQSAVIILFWFTFGSAIKKLDNILSARPSGPKRRGFLALQNFSDHRPTIVAEMAKDSLLVGSTVLLWPVSKSSMFLTMYFTLAVLSGFVGIGLTYSGTLFPFGGKTKIAGKVNPFYAYIASMFVNCLPCCVIVFLAVKLWPFDLRSIKMSLLVAGITSLLLLLTIHRIEPPMLRELRKTRLDLLLRRITTESAFNQLDIAIDGLRINDLLQGDIQNILQKSESVNAHLKAVENRISLVEDRMKDGFERVRAMPTELDTIVALTEAMLMHYGKVVELQVELIKDGKNTRAKLNRMLFIDPPSAEEANNLLSRIQPSLDETVKRAEALKPRIAKIQQSLPQAPSK